MGVHGSGTITSEEGSAGRKSAKREKICAGLAALCLVIAIVFAILFVIYFVKYEDKKDQIDDQKAFLQAIKNGYADRSSATTASSPATTASSPTDSVCKTLDCVQAASDLASTMDVSVDPCVDFSRYACGKFYEDAVIPEDRSRVNSFSTLNDINNKILKKILEEEKKPNDHDFVLKIKGFYASCMDEDQIEKDGVTPYTNSPKRNDWPTLNPAWDAKALRLTLNGQLVTYEKEFTEALFRYETDSNFTNSDLTSLRIKQPTFGISLGDMKGERNHSSLMAYQQYYIDIATELGADNLTAHNDAKEVIDFEYELAKICVSRAEENDDRRALNNPMTLTEMSKKYPYINWLQVFKAIFSTTDIDIDGDQMVNPESTKYFTGLENILKKTDLRVIQNMLSFKYARRILPQTSRSMRAINAKFMKISEGIQKEKPRWIQCTVKVSDLYEMGVGKLFVEKTFSQESKRYMIEMIIDLENSFKQIIKEANWMGETTKNSAYKKMLYLKRKVGYPDNNFSFDDLNKQYEKFRVEKEFYHTYLGHTLEAKRMDLRKLPLPVDHSEWSMSPSVVNAYYQPPSNAINFPAGFLQPIFFSIKYPSSLNYGSIGMVIGHEITHGFDQRGSQYDETGNLRNWWADKDREEFMNRAQCLIDQYSSYQVDQVNLYLNGKQNLGENIADNGGLKEAFRAYQNHSASRQVTELPLPGLGLTTEQQFFVAFARGWCSKESDELMRTRILSWPHSPPLYRIIGPIKNSEGFARAFKCPRGSPMNPVKKCSVW